MNPIKTIEVDNLKYQLNDENKTAGVAGYVKAPEEIFIPRSIIYESQEYRVTEILKRSFYRSLKLKYVKFADDSEIQIIGKKSFYQTSLQTISIPTQLKKICEKAFGKCISLTSVEIPDNSELQSIGRKAFYKTEIECFTIPSKLVELGENWFTDTVKLKQINIMPNNPNFTLYDDKFVLGKSNPQNENFDVLIFANRDLKTALVPNFIRIIGNYSFGRCENLENVEFSDDSELRIICENAFSLSEIKSITIPPKLIELKDGWKYRAESLKSVYISAKNTNFKMYDDKFILGKSNPENEIFDILVYSKNDVKTAVIPEFIRIISAGAFIDCWSLDSVTFKEKCQLESIKKFAFSNTKIKEISIPSTVKEIGKKAFLNCNNLTVVNFTPDSQLQEIKEETFGNTKIQSIWIPPHVKRIRKAIFSRCLINSVDFPENSETCIIDKYAFITSSIKEFTIPPLLTSIHPEILRSLFCLKTYPSNHNFLALNEGNIILTKSSPEIDNFDVIFFVTRKVESFVVPNFIKFISPYAFHCCLYLRQIEFEKGSQLQEIGYSAFYESSLIKIEFPSSLKRICKDSFFFCKNLSTVVFPKDSELQVIEEDSFSATKIDSITIPSKVVEFNTFWNRRSTCLSEIKVDPENTHYKSICDNKVILSKLSPESENFDCVLFATRNLLNVTIPNYVRVIGNNAFADSPNLKNIVFEEGSQLQSIGKNGFIGTKIEKIKIPSSCKVIGSDAFGNCTNLFKFEFDNYSKLEKIEESVFYNSGISSFWVPPSVTHFTGKSFKYTNYLLIIVGFEPNSNLNEIVLEEFTFSYHTLIMIPVELRDKILFKDN